MTNDMSGTNRDDAAFFQNAFPIPRLSRVLPWAGMRRPVGAVTGLPFHPSSSLFQRPTPPKSNRATPSGTSPTHCAGRGMRTHFIATVIQMPDASKRRTRLWPAPSGLNGTGIQNPGRCPGLVWPAPLVLNPRSETCSSTSLNPRTEIQTAKNREIPRRNQDSRGFPLIPVLCVASIANHSSIFA
jgi:hypothetical protein